VENRNREEFSLSLCNSEWNWNIGINHASFWRIFIELSESANAGRKSSRVTESGIFTWNRLPMRVNKGKDMYRLYKKGKCNKMSCKAKECLFFIFQVWSSRKNYRWTSMDLQYQDFEPTKIWKYLTYKYHTKWHLTTPNTLITWPHFTHWKVNLHLFAWQIDHISPQPTLSQKFFSFSLTFMGGEMLHITILLWHYWQIGQIVIWKVHNLYVKGL